MLYRFADFELEPDLAHLVPDRVPSGLPVED